MKTKSVFSLVVLVLGFGLALAFLQRWESEDVAQAAEAAAQSDTTVFAEGFEVDVPPPGWIEEAVSGTDGDWAQASSTVHPSGEGVHGGSYLAYFNSWTADSGSVTRIYTTNLDFSTAGSYHVSLWMYHDTGFSSENDRVQIEVDDGSGWTDVGSAIVRYDDTIGWKEHTVDLSVYAGEVISLSIKGISDYGNDVHIDDVHVFYSFNEFVHLPLVLKNHLPGLTPTPTPTATPTHTPTPAATSTTPRPVAGHWTGTTHPLPGTGGPMSFDVSVDGTQWTSFTVKINWTGCGSSGTKTVIKNGPGNITNNTFSYTSGTYSFTGDFPSATTATGTYSFDNYYICVWIPFPGYCCDLYFTQDGTWTANGP